MRRLPERILMDSSIGFNRKLIQKEEASRDDPDEIVIKIQFKMIAKGRGGLERRFWWASM